MRKMINLKLNQLQSL
ncbi:hypothetical protein Pint_11298 [Pistacia integerrima]|uniref:Uncharacterized protein n=2 Tax=Pistacia integerrima TaxID=434235 RepID=A0ACC0XK05_9ROSI|nr:hypothetical protein Pint_11293 [Pistacia integerrima]KAJ0017687.1 hypothetical protein Pint_11298 [Pistacia integerrima]